MKVLRYDLRSNLPLKKCCALLGSQEGASCPEEWLREALRDAFGQRFARRCLERDASAKIKDFVFGFAARAVLFRDGGPAITKGGRAGGCESHAPLPFAPSLAQGCVGNRPLRRVRRRACAGLGRSEQKVTHVRLCPLRSERAR